MNFAWRSWPGRLAHLWRSSLQLRTVAITVLLSGAAVFVIGSYMSVTIGTNLFEDRRDQVLAETASATAAGQAYFENAIDQSETVELDPIALSGQARILAAVSRPATTHVLILRSLGQDTEARMPSTNSEDFPEDVVSDELRARTAEQGDGVVHWQSVELPSDDGVHPGIVAASTLEVPTAGQYELYLVYDLVDVQDTLTFVQQTLLFGFLALIALIGAVTYVVVLLVVGPVRLAAEVSERLAAGQLEQRIPERGEDVIATLARSFNGMADGLQRQITQLAHLSTVQQRFVSDVSHELRTPLTTIRLAGDVLYNQRETFPPTTARTAELLHTQVRRFEALLADLLEISRYDAGAVELDLEPTNLVRLVEESIEAFEPVAETRGSELRVVAPGGYFDAEVDARRIRRVLRNLLGNALEHGEGKPIEVYVDSDAEAVAIAVRDHGIGMTPEQTERVFDRFWRADPSRQRTMGGTGLGLAISLEDAALHGGTLDVWAEPGHGSCFRLTIPRTRGGALTGSPLPLPPPEPVAAGAEQEKTDD